MKKTITINIAGLVFNIEEDAYSILKSYLEKIGNKFSNSSERQEIMEDIEARIAELFQERINKFKEVITEVDVNHVKEVMGSPDNFEGEEMEDESSFSQENAKKYAKKKRLYRDVDNKVLGGVCVGVANYFGWEVSIVRLVWLFSFLLFGMGMWVYIILWAIIPEAKSTSDKLKMKGKKANLENIEGFFNSVKDGVNDFDKEHFKGNLKKQGNKFNQFLVGTSKKFENKIKPKAVGLFAFIKRIIFPLVGIVAIVAGISIALSFIYSLRDAYSVRNLNEEISLAYSSFSDLLDNPNWLIYCVVGLAVSAIVGFLLFGIKLMVYSKKDTLRRLKPIGFISKSVLLVSILGILIIATFNHISFTQKRNRKIYELNYNKIIIEKFDKETYSETNQNIDLEIFESDIESPVLKIYKNSKGFSSFKMPLEKVDYTYEIQDSIIKLSPSFYVEKNRLQIKKVKVKLYVPKNDSFQLINNFN